MRYQLKQLFYVLVVVLSVAIGADVFAAVTRGATVSVTLNTTDGDGDITHTVDSGTELLLVSVVMRGTFSVSGTPQWSLGGGENLTLVHSSTATGQNDGDRHLEVWGLVSPTSGAGTVSITLSGSTDHVASTAVNYIGTDTASVAAATNFLSEDVNNGATTTNVHASAGNAGNALYFAGGFRGRDGEPSSNNASFNELVDGETGGFSNTADSAINVADLLDSAPSAITVTWSASDANVSVYIEVVAASTAPTFDTNPTLSSCTATGCTFDYDADAVADTIWTMFTDTADSVPTCAAIEAGTDNHGTATEASTGASDSITITATDTPEFPLYDAHFCLEEGTSNYSSVVTVSDNVISDPTGEQFIAITSIGSGSPCESFNTATAPDIANGDYLLADDNTSPGSFALTVTAACQFSYSGDDSRQSVLNIEVYDATAGDWHADDIDFWANNEAPVCSAPEALAVDLDEAITTIDLDTLCTDAELDTLAYTLTSGTHPTGISLSTPNITGTPTVEDEAGAQLTYTGTDIAGDTDTQDIKLCPTDTITMLDLTDSDLAAALADESTMFQCRTASELTSTFKCDGTEALLQVLTQVPTATTEVEHGATITIVTSRGPCALIQRRRE